MFRQLFTSSGAVFGARGENGLPNSNILSIILIVPLLFAGPSQAADLPLAKSLAVAEDALSAMRTRKWNTARRLIAKIGDPAVAKAMKWRLLTRPRSGATFEDIAGFVESNPDWPLQDRLAEQAEFAMGNGTSNDRIVEWFDSHPPVSFAGLQHNIDALWRQGQKLAAAVLARQNWVEQTFRSNRAKAFYRRNKKLLRPEDHAARLESLLWKGHVNSARRMLKSFKFEAGPRRLAEARLLLKSRRTKGKAGRRQVEKALAKVPNELRDDAGLIFDRVRWSRRNNGDEAARAVLLAAPDPTGQERLWWRERNIQIRDSLTAGDTSGAYDLAAHHRQTSGLQLMEAEWMAGWIALRHIGWPERAFEHFTRLYMATSRPISQSRGAYWLGRAADEWGKAEWAQQWFGEAAQYATTFYGQFALARLGRSRIDLPRDPAPTKAERQAFEHMELVRAVRVLQRLGQTELVRPFLIRLRNQATTPQMWVMVAALGVELEQTPDTLRTGKWAARNGHVLVSAAYPIIQLAAQNKVELPLLLALIRQESEFETGAISPAGARGLMQLMPYTARRTAKSLRIRYARGLLTSDPGYNVKLGIAYLASLLDQYDGSYVLSLAAYNAGPNNVAAWLRRFGDPRKGGVDIVDWIESIPFGETRNYVQRILEGLQTYRAQFGDQRLAAASSMELWRPSQKIANTANNARCVANALVYSVPPPC